jgi:REP element-mobilizing transposase RayT
MTPDLPALHKAATVGRGLTARRLLCGIIRAMRRTLGYHIVISGYGLWLPGDDRGHWSEAWDDELGYIEPHMLHAGDPVRKRMAEERQKQPPVRLDEAMQLVVVDTISRCRVESDWRIAAASIEATHVHLLMTYTERDIDNTVKWLKDQMTKAIHRQTSHHGPVWCKGRWRSFIYELAAWQNAQAYIERHNVRRGVGARPYAFIEL